MYSRLFLRGIAGSRQKCLLHKSSRFPPIGQLQDKEVHHLLSPKLSLLGGPRPRAAPGAELLGNREARPWRLDLVGVCVGTRPAWIQMPGPKMPRPSC